MTAAGQQPGPVLMSLRVSRDGGRTYGPVREFRRGDDLPPLESSTWPPCQCPRHRT
ncbi:hypothetical protein [Streptomyces sp. NPDC057496]|uniref:hypothetical protein n=1 Tax=Streptomyces sp. NPDC057496 TaxID=3346149 RepID=UPI0036AC50E8